MFLTHNHGPGISLIKRVKHGWCGAWILRSIPEVPWV
jgi:hypothetical protein